MTHNGRRFIQIPEQEKLFYDQQYPVEHAPQHIIPACSMPKTGEQPHDCNIAKLGSKSPTVAAKRDIHIIPEPCTEGNVPAPPKFRNAFRDIRIIKVFEETESEHFSEADCHIRVSRKIKIQLQSEGDNAKPRAYNGELISRQLRDSFPDESYVVCKEDFFTQTAHKAFYAVTKQINAMYTVVYLVCNCLIANDGARNQLWEQRNIRAERQNVFLHLRISAIHINGIAHGLKGVKGDTDGEQQIRLRNSQPGQRIQIVNKEIAVFEHAQ